MSHALYRWGRFAARHPWRVIGAWLLAAVLVVTGSAAFGGDLEDSFEAPGVDSQLAVELLSRVDSDQAGLTARVVATTRDADTTFFESAAAQQELAATRAAVAELPNVIWVSDPAAQIEQGLDTAVGAGAVSADGTVALIDIQYPEVEFVDLSDMQRLKAIVDNDSESTRLEAGGDLFFAFDEPETGIGEVLGLLVAVVVLLVAFGSIVAMGLPIALALFGLTIGVTSLGLVTHLVQIPAWVPTIGAMVGLGVGIDYALFWVTRHREFLARGLTVEESVGRAVATSGQAVIFAGGTVVVAILGLGVAGVPFMTAAGIGISLIVFVMVAATITLLPALLGVVGTSIDRLSVRRSGHGDQGAGAVTPGWERWGRHVSDHAWPYAIGVTAGLLLLTAPVLDLRLGFPDEGTLAESTTQRQAYDLVADAFGPGINGPLLVAVDISTDASVVEPLAAAIGMDAGVASVAPALIDAENGVATIVVIATTAPQEVATVDTIERLRTDVFPEVLAASPAVAHVGGQTATFADVAGRISDRLAMFIAAVVLVSFVLLTMVFRSVVVPLKAALLNLLSIGAAYGVLVAVFQWGWGLGLIGLDSTVPIVSFIPMFMFAMLFGLSMDYEVFLLSRVREEYLITGDNEGSVIAGLASTARVITSAALIMISVFGGFVLSDDPVTKMFGLGLATAIFVDATVVRMILVPATMKLMGDANWWTPRWLDRILPTIDIEGESGLPEPEYRLDVADLDAADPTPVASLASSVAHGG